MNLLKYSNGWGHLIMSLATMAAAVFLIAIGQVTLGSSMIGLVTTAWFVLNAAKQVAYQVTTQVTSAQETPVASSPPTPEGKPGANGGQ